MANLPRYERYSKEIYNMYTLMKSTIAIHNKKYTIAIYKKEIYTRYNTKIYRRYSKDMNDRYIQ